MNTAKQPTNPVWNVYTPPQKDPAPEQRIVEGTIVMVLGAGLTLGIHRISGVPLLPWEAFSGLVLRDPASFVRSLWPVLAVLTSEVTALAGVLRTGGGYHGLTYEGRSRRLASPPDPHEKGTYR